MFHVHMLQRGGCARTCESARWARRSSVLGELRHKKVSGPRTRRVGAFQPRNRTPTADQVAKVNERDRRRKVSPWSLLLLLAGAAGTSKVVVVCVLAVVKVGSEACAA